MSTLTTSEGKKCLVSTYERSLIRENKKLFVIDVSIIKKTVIKEGAA